MEQLLTQMMLPAEATRGAVVGQQMLPVIDTGHDDKQVKAEALRYA